MMRCKLFVRAVTLIIFAAGFTTAPAAELDVPAVASPAEEASPAPDEMGPPAPPLLMRKTMETHVVVSHGLERMARRIDSFFAADQAFEESTRSYARLRFDTILDQDMQISFDGWLMRTAGNLFWFVSDGAGASSTLDFDRAMGETALFRSGTTLRWAETDQFLTAEQLMSIYQRIDPRRYVVYQVGAVATRDPDWAMQQYFVAVHFRKNVYKNWLFMEVIPQINYTVDRDFRADPTHTFRS